MKLFYQIFTKKTILSILIVQCSILSFATTYYVSNSGNDSNSGLTTILAWKTLANVNVLTFKAGDQILFRKGDTFYGTLSVHNSGTSGNPITYGAYGIGNNPIITGFTTVTEWTNLGGNIWESTAAVSTLSTCNMVVINGVNAPMGRYPNSGYLTYQTFSTNTSITSSSLTGTPNWTGAEVVIKKKRWVIDRNLITSQSGGTLNYTAASSYYGQNGWGFFIQNDLRTLDQQNEWYYNPSTKKLSVYSTSEPTGVQLTTTDTLININTHGYITIDNISFQGSNRAAVYIKNSPHVTIQNCSFEFSGVDAIYGENWSNSNYFVLNNCTIDHSNNDAVYLAYSYDYSTITNNTITNSGMIAGAGSSGDNTYSALVMTNLTNTMVQYNEINNTGYIGIGLLGYLSGSCDNTTITNNLVNNFCIVKDDGGGIYTHTAGAGKIISFNTVLNGIGTEAGVGPSMAGISAAMGIYIDQNNNTSGISVLNNSVANIGSVGIYINNAIDIIVKNNTVYNSTFAAIEIANDIGTVTMTGVQVNNNIFFAKNV